MQARAADNNQLTRSSYSTIDLQQSCQLIYRYIFKTEWENGYGAGKIRYAV